MRQTRRWYQTISMMGLLMLLTTLPVNAVVIDARVDATDLPRGLLKASTVYQAEAGTFALYYPQWLEGIHGPTHPIQNLAEIAIHTPEGEQLSWKRDPHNAYRFLVEVPENTGRIVAETTYICNQAATGSLGVDSHGNSMLGIVCWNTCLLYPDGHNVQDIEVNLSLTLPEGWKWGSSLTAEETDGGMIRFSPVSYRELVDSPLICGKHTRKIDLTPPGATPHYLHLVSESKRVLSPDETVISKLKSMVAEAMAMFGTAHDYDYHFLLVLSDNMPFIGLEHKKSSLNAVSENGLEDENKLVTTAHLLTHEYGHRWCGKYHRPQGMDTPNYNTPKDLRLLWVYEGLDQYIGVVLTARAGLFATKSQTSFEGGLRDGWVGVGKTMLSLMRQKGRRSISLEDTASSSYLRRQRSRYWSGLNRRQDYYFEGALLWYEIDTILREKTESKISLDDFIRRFLGRYDRAKPLICYTEQDVIDTLNEFVPYDWKTLIEDRVRGLHSELPLDVLDRLGYRIAYSSQPTDYDKDPSRTALGMTVSTNGTISTIDPDGPADRAGLREDAKIVGIDHRKFSFNALKDAIADSIAKRMIELLLLEGDEFVKVEIEYDDGPKYMDIVRNDKPDVLSDIFTPQVHD